MGRIILVTGGARSGKSSFAEQLTGGMGAEIAYIATAMALDAEMEDRIAKHRRQRPDCWQTFEAPTHPAGVIGERGNHVDAILLDCLTVMATNRMLDQPPSVDWEHPTVAQMNAIEANVLAEVEAIIAAATGVRADLVAVTNEVGFGIVPLSPLSRFFRDCVGRVNQRMARAAAEVYLVVSGIPVRIKGEGAA